MKRIVFLCCLAAAIVFGGAYAPKSYAQAGLPHAIISQADLMAQASQLKSLLDDSRTTEAHAKWDEIHLMLKTALANTKSKVADAVAAHNDAGRDSYTELIKIQQGKYYEIVKLRDDLAGNKMAMFTRINDFAATIH